MPKPEHSDYIQAAINAWASDDCVIDADIPVREAPSSGGAWVAAWLWVSDATAFRSQPGPRATTPHSGRGE